MLCVCLCVLCVTGDVGVGGGGESDFYAATGAYRSVYARQAVQ